MKTKQIFAFLVSLIILLSFVSCDYIVPNVEKSKTEKEQLEQLKIQNNLLIDQNKQLARIADALEKLIKEK